MEESRTSTARNGRWRVASGARLRGSKSRSFDSAEVRSAQDDSSIFDMNDGDTAIVSETNEPAFSSTCNVESADFLREICKDLLRCRIGPNRPSRFGI